MKITNLIATSLLLTILFGCSEIKTDQKTEFPILSGAYLGQKMPGDTAEIFASGIISNGLVNRDVAISPDGNAMYFGLHTVDFSYATIIFTKLENGNWTRPEVAEFATDPRYVYLEPALSFDGEKLFFLSNMPKDSTENPGDEDIWAVDKTNKGWGKPYNLGEPINTAGGEFYPSTTKDGSLYFTRVDEGERVHYIYRSRLVNGKYSQPERLPEQVNCGTNRFNAFISPDESYLIIPAVGMPDGMGGADYYIVFRNEDDSWEEPINMGPKINSAVGTGWSFYTSLDSKYIFYMATKKSEDKPDVLDYDFFLNRANEAQNGTADIYWMSSQIIEDLKQQIKPRLP